MTGLNFRHISYFYRKFGPVIYPTCTGWIRYPDAGHIENSIFRLVCLKKKQLKLNGKDPSI